MAFPHHDLRGAALDADANDRFNEWLEQTAPGARHEGRVTGIRFADVQDTAMRP